MPHSTSPQKSKQRKKKKRNKRSNEIIPYKITLHASMMENIHSPPNPPIEPRQNCLPSLLHPPSKSTTLPREQTSDRPTMIDHRGWQKLGYSAVAVSKGWARIDPRRASNFSTPLPLPMKDSRAKRG